LTFRLKRRGGEPSLIRQELTVLRAAQAADSQKRIEQMQSNGLIGRILFTDKEARNACLNDITIQYLTGHGAFRAYLHWRKCTDDPICPHCMLRTEETASHILFECDGYEQERIAFSIDNLSFPDTERKVTWNVNQASMFDAYCRACEKGRTVRNRV